MGFMDKAKKAAQDAAVQGKKLAEQAQTKLDEVQKDFNSKQSGGAQGEASATPAADYDSHGRPVATPDAGQTAGPSGDPLGEAAPPAPSEEPVATPEDESATPPHGDPVRPPSPPSAGAGLTSGDPLAG